MYDLEMLCVMSYCEAMMRASRGTCRCYDNIEKFNIIPGQEVNVWVYTLTMITTIPTN